ncbi:glycosyltransferase [Roseomonas marmotae]|uniref:Glycosyltransferase family 1 protein n=1 Tax=Roseomonas marmotae TaxID=2768161 RepID=A0ABS3K7R0_9PROT|nr:glycosyltransferase [Roseomonas marmotae]MBO1073470.1 glycosyltransferase family 1 protein [Roseomonas marmotae]QTI80337.1 glycosyltransferase family 1 protein [Roseomonas marmotae]
MPPSIILATFEGGGHVTPAAQLARRLQADGADIRFVSDEASRAAATGLRFLPWRRAPNRQPGAEAAAPLRDYLRALWPPALVHDLCQEVICTPALAYAEDLLAMLREEPADLIVTNELLLGAMLAGERAGVPVASFSANIWPYPTRPDLPPFGPGFRPGSREWQARRDAFARDWTFRLYDAGLPALNAARAALGLPPLAHVLDQLRVLRLSLLATAQAFDFGIPAVPEPFAYAGPLLERPPWAGDWRPGEPGLPHVLISASTTFMGQTGLLRRSVSALRGLPLRGVLTLGPAVDPASLPASPQVELLRGADHDAILPHCAAAIVQGGHGSVIRPLLHGVPLLCLPLGRDNADNAARVAHAGAGIALSGRAPAWRIRRALQRLLREAGFARNARRLGQAIAREADGGAAASARLLALAGQG